MADTKKDKKASKRKDKKSLVRNKKGGTEFIEKVIMIGLFALVAAVGVSYIAEKVGHKFTEQGDTIEADVHGGIPTP